MIDLGFKMIDVWPRLIEMPSFTVTLPLLAADSDSKNADRAFFSSVPVASASSTILQGLRVLVIDDEEDARELLTIALTQSGAKVRTAGTVEAALELLNQWNPNVLVSDIGMPGENGYGLIRTVRAHVLIADRLGTVRDIAGLTRQAIKLKLVPID